MHRRHTCYSRLATLVCIPLAASATCPPESSSAPIYSLAEHPNWFHRRPRPALRERAPVPDTRKTFPASVLPPLLLLGLLPPRLRHRRLVWVRASAAARRSTGPTPAPALLGAALVRGAGSAGTTLKSAGRLDVRQLLQVQDRRRWRIQSEYCK